MRASELFCRAWDAPYKHGERYSGSYAVWKWEEENTLVVSFQQTVQKKDWLQNFKIWPAVFCYTDGRKVKVHAGFLQQLTEIFLDVKNDTLDFMLANTVEKVIVCGWSQGAVSALLFYKIMFSFFKTFGIENQCVLFGMPNFVQKSSLPKMPDFPNEKITEFQHSCDLFTYLPPFYGKPAVKKIVFGEPFCLFKAVFGIRKYHTSYIKCNGGDIEL